MLSHEGIKNVMKYFLSITSLCFLTFLVSSGSTNAERYVGIDPEKMMKLKEINIMGINLAMLMGDILATLEKQGINLDCSKGIVECLARTDEFELRVQHMPRKIGQRPNMEIDRNAPPFAIGFGQIIGDPDNCTTINQTLKLFCSDGVDKHPCRKDNFGMVTAELSAAGKKSSDGFSYQGRIGVKPPQLCNIRMQRVGMSK